MVSPGIYLFIYFFFASVQNFDFEVVSEVKEQKIAQNDQKLCRT